MVCAPCAQQIQANQQPVRSSLLWRAALYGAGAALAGSALYAAVAIFLNLEIGIIAILVGWMVGKAVRHACQGRGGRPQQILAVALTYFSISTSYIPVMVYQLAKHPPAAVKQAQQQAKNGQVTSGGTRPATRSAKGVGSAVGILLIALLTLAAIAPFLSLTAGISGLISLFILFIGMQRAWKLTERRQIPLVGPFTAEAAQ
jgi:hypothetical protein